MNQPPIFRRIKDSTTLDVLNKLAIALLVFFGQQMYSDLRTLSTSVPVIQEQIKVLQEETGRLRTKVFTTVPPRIPLFAKKEDEQQFALNYETDNR